VTFTATITAGATGTVTFKNGGATLGTATLNTTTHKASITRSTLTVGTHSITAVYGGNANYAASTSAVLKQVVN
jgi:Big-like domain-containing protein